MSVLLTGDLHLTDNPRDAYRHVFMKETLPHIIHEMGVEHLYISGDLTEAKDHHSARLVNAIAGYMKALPCKITIVCGNHDYDSAAHPFFEFLKHQPKITWIGQPSEVGRWLFLPHTSNWLKDWEGIDFSRYAAIFCHQTFTGAKVGSRTLEGIPIDFLRGRKVYSGDVHSPQKFGPITYIGAPYTVDFGDDFEPRVILLDGKTETNIPVPGMQKRLLDITIGQKLEARFNRGDIIKVRAQIPMRMMDQWGAEKERIRLWAVKHGYEIWAIQPTVDPSDRKKMHKQVHRQAQSDSELVRQYSTLKRVSEQVTKAGIQIVENR